jgi:cellulose synthase (UDP-forming)
VNPQEQVHIPNPPTDEEKYSYITHHQYLLSVFAFVAVAGVAYSTLRFILIRPLFYVLFPFWILSLVTFLVYVVVQGLGRSYDLSQHTDLVDGWNPSEYPSIDVFLPTWGEDIRILQNTWEGVSELIANYPGSVTTYCLDDGDRESTEQLAKKFGWEYLVREDRPSFRKAGNLQNAFQLSDGDFILLFDADFRPRPDFLREVLPYFYQNERLGIVQTPQFFDVDERQNWIERSAGAVQEYFYRSIQQNRDKNGESICVGSNSIYRRAALDANDGFSLMMHSEDVHTGFDVRLHGWDIKYLPLNLAKGVCPNTILSFYRQQHRWCRGSMSLCGSRKFWRRKMGWRVRLSYLSGFLYYLNTAALSIALPLIPLALLFIDPKVAQLRNYVYLLPAIIYAYVVLPLWHRCKYYRLEIYSLKMIYGWSHLFAIWGEMRGKSLTWQATGTQESTRSDFRQFQLAMYAYTLPTGILWTLGSLWHIFNWNFWNFFPITASGIVYLLAALRVVILLMLDARGRQTDLADADPRGNGFSQHLRRIIGQ